MSSVHIEVVDDDAAMRDLIAQVLREDGYLVTTAADGAQALRQLHNRRPDAVILDLSMPRVGGEEFLRSCRAEPALANLPIALCSSNPRAVEIAATYGARTVVPKPFDVDDLLAEVRRLVRTSPVVATACSGTSPEVAATAETRARPAA
ncbi:MAG TPA: response regulator [Chloroflexota bacterium]|nr:response regulator [Chloroflexota bacterium]